MKHIHFFIPSWDEPNVDLYTTIQDQLNASVVYLDYLGENVADDIIYLLDQITTYNRIMPIDSETTISFTCIGLGSFWGKYIAGMLSEQKNVKIVMIDPELNPCLDMMDCDYEKFYDSQDVDSVHVVYTSGADINQEDNKQFLQSNYTQELIVAECPEYSDCDDDIVLTLVEKLEPSRFDEVFPKISRNFD
jgi:predicted esterase YcpF (UPF0227 family)